MTLPVTPQRSPQTVSEHFKIMVTLEIDRERIPIQALFNSPVYPPTEKHLKMDKPELLTTLNSLVENVQSFNDKVDEFDTELRNQLRIACERVLPEELASGEIEIDESARVLGGYCVFIDVLFKNGSLASGAIRQPEVYEMNFWRVGVSAAGDCSIGGGTVGRKFTEAKADKFRALLENIVHTESVFKTVEHFVTQRAELDVDGGRIGKMAEELVYLVLDGKYKTVIPNCCPVS